MQDERDRDVQRLLTWALIFVLLLALAELLWMGLRRIAQDGQTAPPPVRRAPADEEASEMAEATFGWDVTPTRFYDLADLDGHGAAFPFPSGPATDSYETDHAGTRTDPWPDPMPYIEQDHNGDMLYSTYVVYDEETLVPSCIRAYLVREYMGGGVVRCGIYTEAGDYIAGSAWQALGDGEGWVTFGLSGAPPLVEGKKYTLWVCADHPEIETIRLGTGLPPVVLSEVIPVTEVLRLAVRFGETIPIAERLRVGVSFSETIPISEEIKTRLKPSPETGFCFGHHVSDEDAGGRFD